MAHLPVRRPTLLAGTAVLAIALAAAACSLFTKKEAPPPCPEVSLLQEASHITKFANGPGRDLIDVLYQGQITDASGSCTYDLDKKTRTGTVDMQMNVAMNLSRGPADRDGKAPVSYFVAVTGKNQQILNKQRFTATVAFPPNTSKISWQDEPVYLSIPLKAGQTGRDFRIFVGYDVTHEELQYNRKQSDEIGP